MSSPLRTPRWALAVVFAAAGCSTVSDDRGAAPAPPSGGASVDLVLPDGAFFGGADLSEAEATLAESEFDGVALFGPASVDTSLRSTLPLLVASRLDGRRAWDRPLRRHATLVAVNVGTTERRSAPPFAPTKREAPVDSPPRPTDEELAGFGAELVRVDAREVLALPWEQGVWDLSIEYDGQRSRAVRVTIGPGVPE